MLGVQNQEVEAGDRQQLSDTGRGPCQEAAEKSFVRAEALAKRAISFQLTALSFRRREVSIRLISVTRF